jgi:hypothetical protein
MTEQQIKYARAIAFAAAVAMPVDDGRQAPGVIALANESRFSESYFNQTATGYAVGGWDKTDIEAEANFFCPPVLVPRKFTYSEFINAEEMLSETVDDLRAIGGDFKRVEYTSKKTTAQTDNRGLTVRVDLDEIADKSNWENMTVDRLIRRLKRNKLRRAITLIAAAATNTARTWDASAGKDPDQDVRTSLLTATTASGLRPNRVGYGDTAWDKRVLSHRFQNNAGGYASAILSAQELATQLMVDQVLVSKSRYQSGAAAKTEIVNNLVLSFLGYDGMGEEDPSNVKGFWSPCEGGGPVRFYTQQISAKLYDVTVEHDELTKITSTLGIRKETIS